tara:strand:- start:62 stop:610 length:549 start_codon:yes stop_codon:yes gene_type:complete
MATKTKTKLKDKIKNSLKSKLKNELVEQKETQQKEIREKNANLREVILYTRGGCSYCKQLMDQLKEDGIKFIEKEQSKHQEEWKQVTMLTGVPVFPTVLINENYLSPRRDFQNVQQATQIISILGNKEFINPPFETRVIEILKTMGYGMNQSITGITNQIRPLLTFIQNLQSQLEEEEKTEE